MSYVKESTMPGKENYGYIFDQTVLVNATNYEKLFLKAMLEELSGRKQVAFFSKVFEKLIAMCQKEQIKCPSPTRRLSCVWPWPELMSSISNKGPQRWNGRSPSTLLVTTSTSP